MKEKNIFPAILSAAVAVLLVVSLVPVLMVGDCAHPFGDDYAFSQFVHHAMEDGNSVLGALGYTIHRYYFGWQGTYAGAALMALQPGIYGEQMYILTPIIMLTMLICSTGVLTHVLFRRWLGQSRAVWLGATAALLLVTIQYQPNVRESFFWWNGSVYYTGFYSFMLLLIACMVTMRLEGVRHTKVLFALAIALAAIVGGGNYVTGLLSCLLLAAYTLYCLIWERERVWKTLTVTLVLMAGFLINVLAPGNSVRQDMSVGMGVFSAVLESVLQAGRDCVGWFHLPTLALLVCLVPVLWRGLERVKFSFPLPVPVTVLLFLVLACQNAPHFYALSAAGPGRLRNIVYDSYPWLLLLAEGYWLGWLRHRLEDKTLPSRIAGGAAMLAMALAILGFALTGQKTATGQCVQALSDGSAREYDRHINGWIEILSDPDTDDVTVEQLPVYPPLLYSFNLVENPEDFANITAANYYRKSSVTAR